MRIYVGFDDTDEPYSDRGTGKLARWFDAILHERECSLDTLHDLGIYTKMAIRNRQVGGWPGTEA